MIAILCAGLWGIWKALVQRRYAETAGAIGMSVAFAVAALFLVYRPVETVGTASAWSNQLSNAFLSIATVGPEPVGGVGPRRPGRPETTKAELSDRLFRAFVYDPWVVLNFGGARATASNARDEPTGARGRRAGRASAASTTARPTPRTGCATPAFSDERKAEYEALNRGEGARGARRRRPRARRRRAPPRRDRARRGRRALLGTGRRGAGRAGAVRRAHGLPRRRAGGRHAAGGRRARPPRARPARLRGQPRRGGPARGAVARHRARPGDRPAARGLRPDRARSPPSSRAAGTTSSAPGCGGSSRRLCARRSTR